MHEKGGEFWGLSPFKEERTPSFSVRRETGKFYDFSSGHGGNVLTFAIKMLGSLPEAVESLKKFAGVTDTMEYRPRLEASKIAKKYRSKGESEKAYDTSTLQSDYMERYEFDTDKLSSWAMEGISYDVMRKFGVRYDMFSDRIVYPIKNISGDIINVSGRTLDKNFKEHGLRKYTYFRSLGSNPTIYGISDNLDAIRRTNEVILFEGAKSVLLCSTWGINNTGAVMTSHLSRKQFEILLKLNVPVTIAFDSEVDVRKDEFVMKLRHYLPVYWLKNQDNLLELKDSPVDRGKEVFLNLYKRKLKL